MNQEQLETARAHYEELIYGMPNIDVKALGLREFCHRKWRMKNKIRLTLWALTPEWISYIEEKNREEVASISKQSKVSDSCSDFSTFVQEVSSVESVDAHGDPLLAKMENSLRIGECHIASTFDRATLLFRHYERLVGDGLTMDELIDADLVGMLSQYLDYKRCDKRFYIKDPRKQLNLMYLIHKYYKKDSSEYESFVAEIYDQESLKWGTTKLERVPKHLFISLRRFDKTISPSINFYEYWELVESLKTTEKYNAWEDELIKQRRSLTITVVKECQRRIKNKETELRHPFKIGIYALTCLAYTIIKESEKVGFSILLCNEDTLLELLKNCDWDEVNSIVKYIKDSS